MVILNRIYTRTGDDGSTGLGDGSRTGKDSLRIHAIGDIDELNSNIGLLLCEQLAAAMREIVSERWPKGSSSSAKIETQVKASSGVSGNPRQRCAASVAKSTTVDTAT